MQAPTAMTSSGTSLHLSPHPDWKILLHFSCHLGIFIKLLGIKQSYGVPLLWPPPEHPACLNLCCLDSVTYKMKITIMDYKDENWVWQTGRLKNLCSVNAIACWCKWVKRWKALMQSNMSHTAMFWVLRFSKVKNSKG